MRRYSTTLMPLEVGQELGILTVAVCAANKEHRTELR
jgi:hypothetical protein